MNPGQWVHRGKLVPLGGHPTGVIRGAVKIVILIVMKIVMKNQHSIQISNCVAALNPLD